MKTASDIMTTPVISVGPETSIEQAANLMLEHRISGLPVIDDQEGLIGIVTEADMLRRSDLGTEPMHSHLHEFLMSPGKLAHEYTHSHARKVSEIMKHEIVSGVIMDPSSDKKSKVDR